MILIYYHCEEVEKYLMQYYEQTGFEYHKRRVEYDENNIVQKRTYECTKAAQYKPRKDNEDQKRHNVMTGIQHIDEKFFGSILQVLKDFLTPNMLIIAKKEISASISYEVMQINLNLNLDTLVS